MAQRTSVALFLATSALLGTTAASIGKAGAESQFPAPRNPQHLAQATECVPIGEGENCARERSRSNKAVPAAAAAVGSGSVNKTDPGASPKAKAQD